LSKCVCLPLEAGGQFQEFKYEELWTYSLTDELYSTICISFLEEAMNFNNFFDLCEKCYDGLSERDELLSKKEHFGVAKILFKFHDVKHWKSLRFETVTLRIHESKMNIRKDKFGSTINER